MRPARGRPIVPRIGGLRALRAQPRPALHVRRIAFDGGGGNGPVRDGGDHLAQPLVAHVPGGVDPFRPRPLFPVGNDIAPLGQFRKPFGKPRGRFVPGEDEYPEALALRRRIRFLPPGHGVAEHGAAQGRVAFHRFQDGIEAHPDGFVGQHLFGDAFGAGQRAPAHEHGHGAGVAGEVHGFLGGGEPAAHHKHVPARKEPAVACGAVGHAPAPERLLAFKAHLAGMGPGGEQHGEAPESPPARAHDAEIPVHVDPLRFGQQELRAEMPGLTAHRLGEQMAVNPFHAGIIHHFGGEGYLPAEGVLLHDKHPVPGAGKVEGGGKPCRAAPHHHGVVQIRSPGGVHYSRPTRSRLGFRVSAPGRHLAGHT